MTSFTCKTLRKLPLLLLVCAGLASAAPDTNNGRGNGSLADGPRFGAHVVQNGRTAIKGNIWTLQHIYYVGDELDIRLQFARGHQLLASGDAEAHVVVFARDGRVVAVPVPADFGASSRKFFRVESVDIDTLPEGQYQLGLVVTVPGGDPTLLDDWYGGFRALLDSEAIFIAATPVDTDDDLDGEHDDDADGDGIDGEEEDEEDDDAAP